MDFTSHSGNPATISPARSRQKAKVLNWYSSFNKRATLDGETSAR